MHYYRQSSVRDGWLLLLPKSPKASWCQYSFYTHLFLQSMLINKSGPWIHAALFVRQKKLIFNLWLCIVNPLLYWYTVYMRLWLTSPRKGNTFNLLQIFIYFLSSVFVFLFQQQDWLPLRLHNLFLPSSMNSYITHCFRHLSRPFLRLPVFEPSPSFHLWWTPSLLESARLRSSKEIFISWSRNFSLALILCAKRAHLKRLSDLAKWAYQIEGCFDNKASKV